MKNNKMKKSQLRKIIKEEIQHIISEGFKPTDDTVMIMIGHDDKYYPWYAKKLKDSTHLNFVNSDKYLDTPGGRHVGEFKGESYYKDLRMWLKGSIKSKDINGKKYEGVG